MSKAKKLPSGSWRVLVYSHTETVDGIPKRRYRSFTAATKKEAEYLAAEFKLSAKRSADPLTMTVSECICGYIDSKENILSPSTIASYRKNLRNHLSQLDFAVSKLSTATLQPFFNRLSKDLSPKTLRNIHGLLFSAVKHYDPSFNISVTLPEKRPHEIVIPSSDDVRRMLALTESHDLHIPILLACFMGLRRSEIVALKVSDLNFSSQTLHIHSALVVDSDNDIVRKGTKSFSGTRVLSVPAPVFDLLRTFSTEKPTDAPLTPYTSPKALSAAYTRFSRTNHFEGYTFHSLRHYYASLLLSKNVPTKYAMTRMGHATDHMLKNVYQHIMREKDDAVTELINEAIANDFF